MFGTEGGHGQAQTHLQLLTRMIVDGDDPQAAITAPRFTIDPETGRVAVEDHFEPAWIEDLRGRGHEIDVVPALPPRPGDRARDRMSSTPGTAPAPTPGPKAVPPVCERCVA